MVRPWQARVALEDGGFQPGSAAGRVIPAESIRVNEAVTPWLAGEISAARGAAGFDEQLRLL